LVIIARFRLLYDAANLIVCEVKSLPLFTHGAAPYFRPIMKQLLGGANYEIETFFTPAANGLNDELTPQSYSDC
jgi:hypothetical protein